MKKNERAARVLAARKLLGLRAAATQAEIREAYRDLARDCHPDQRPAGEHEQWEAQMRELNAAYETLMDYCSQYSFSFDPEVVEQQCRKQDPVEYWKDRFFE